MICSGLHIISSTIIQCCDVQKSYGENLSSPSLETFRLSAQSVCPMFNAGSMLHRLNKAYFSFICGEEVFVKLFAEKNRASR